MRTREHARLMLADLTTPGQTVDLAHGGGGGRGNAYFASATNQYPLLAEKGEPGQSLNLQLELKLLADVGSNRPAERGQVEPAFRSQCGAAQGSELPVHDTGAGAGRG